MKIVYAANHGNRHSDDTEGHIARALRELGHTVECVPQDKSLPKGDMLLYHKWTPPRWDGIKVCWYFDKVWKGRQIDMAKTIKSSDFVFLTDETWAKKHRSDKLHILRQGIGDSRPGTKKDSSFEVAFVGSTYEGRAKWAHSLKKRLRGKFVVYNGLYNRQMNDLCASMKIFVAPPFPSDDYYWSNRVYLITGSGGFMIHPRLKGLEKEYTDKEIVFYDDEADMYEKIDYYLEHPEEREEIRLAGYNKTKDLYTYKTRCQKLLETIQV